MVKYLFYFLTCSILFGQPSASFKRGKPIKTEIDCCEAAPDYIYSEDFEEMEVGIPADGWVNSAITEGSFDFASSTAPLLGTKSVKIIGGARLYNTGLYIPSSEVWVYFRYKRINVADGGVCFYLTDGQPEPMIGIDITYAGIVKVFQFNSSTYVSAETTDTFPVGTETHIWLHYIAGTGNNSTAEIYVSSTEARPSYGSGGHAILVNGPATENVTGMWLYTNYGTDVVLYDKIRVSTTVIRGYPL